MNFNKSRIYVTALLLAFTAFSACKKDDSPEDNIPVVKGQANISGEISKTRTLSADTVYLLKGYVRVLSGGKLVIPAGTVIKGEKASKAALIIEMGGKIDANGTAAKPIVFTSDQPAGSRNIGDWSGVIISGKSTVNTAGGTGQYEGGILGAGVAAYGGTDPADNSGSLTYARIEFAGIAIEKDKEINGLTLCGVGSGTTIHHIQVSYGGDDAFEFFGGTVNATHLIAYRSTDDDFDFDQGYTGKLQFGISLKDPNIADVAGTSRGIELENKGTVTGSIYSRPVLSNFTFVGPGTNAIAAHGAGIHFGTNSRMVLANSIIVNHKGNGVEFNSDFPAAELLAGRSVFSNNIVFGNTANYGLTSVTSFADDAALTTFLTGKGNVTVANLDAAGLTSISLSTPNLTLKTTSPANGKAKFEGDLATGFTAATYAGAMGTTDWTTGWANWDPKNTEY